MIPDFFLSPDQSSHFGIWKIVIGFLIVFIGTCVGVEIRFGNDDEDR